MAPESAGVNRDHSGPRRRDPHECVPLPGFEQVLAAQKRGTVARVATVGLHEPRWQKKPPPGWRPESGSISWWWNGTTWEPARQN